MIERRIVRLLDKPALTGRQLAQRRYRQSAKGRAATKRARVKRRNDPKYLAELRARADAWKKAHPVHVRVYNRVYQQRRKREQGWMAGENQ